MWLVGDFNDWSRTAHPLRREGEWFSTELELEPDRTYRYRYLLDGDRWENDWAADGYLPNEHGTDDSVAEVARLESALGIGDLAKFTPPRS